MYRSILSFILLLSLSAPLSAQQSGSVTASDDKWDVTASHGDTKTVEFTTTEATWMSVDVSPDGSLLVFDVLGDIYTMPVDGGKATRISGGSAYDVQPRFSPDGTKIAFTSDRAGGDNLWVMNQDGSNPAQVSTENFRLVNGPAWTPDGQYLLGRKHFSSERSLGAGEVWMYHISGGSGMQLTKQKNDQQDQGNEIAVSPDGRYVYFSEDVTPGPTFQYNKDPNGQIYVVKQLDRETGRIKNLITGQGGSARPVPSPDGKSIAFVRRDRANSVLFIYDIESGVSRPIYEGLDHDQQETWAIFGVYPNFAWTPDNKNIVIWAGGHLQKVEIGSTLANTTVSPIPFSVDVSVTVTSPPQSTQVVSPPTFDAKMIRDVATSPSGTTIAFNAIGHIWTKTLPNGTPKRVTTDNRFEGEPSFSPDGKWIVYSTWDDNELGGIFRVAATGGPSVKLSSQKGYFWSPRYSPDGKLIVFQKGSGNGLLGTDFSTNTGLFWMKADGSSTTLIQENGSDARVGPDNRVYFLAGGGLSKEYRSVRLDGGDERFHFKLKYANTIVPSPDFQWVAFTELHNAFIAPFPQTGTALELTKDTKAIPVKQISRDAGMYLHWAPNSKAVHWVLGPEYFTRSLKDSFSFVDGAPSDLPAIDSSGVAIGLKVQTDVPQGVTAFTNARVVTMKGDEVLEGVTLVVENNRITALGKNVSIPKGATIIDAKGKTIMPGMIDVHGHAQHFNEGFGPQQNWVYYANLAYGVTTSHDPSANTSFVFAQSELVKAGLTVGPRIFSTGTILYGADGDFKAVINNLEDARSHMRRMKAVGAFSVKSYNQPRREQRQQVLQAARELEMLVVPEGGSTFFTNITMILDGHTGIEHNIPVAPLYNDILSVWAENPVGYTPTLVVSYGGINGEYYWYQNTNVWEQKRLLNFHPKDAIDSRSRRRLMVPDDEWEYQEVARSAKDLIDRGGKVQIGAHGQRQGLGAHWELWMFVQGGMTNLEALRSATLSGAEYLGLDKDLGSLEVGKLADLLVLDKNPLEDIRNSESINSVMINGRLYDAWTMDEIGNHPKPRANFFWEK